MKQLMTQQWPSAFSTSVALQISHEALSAEMLALYCKHSQQWGYKEDRPSGLCQFFSFCLVRPAGGCAPSSRWCSRFDSKQRLGKWARLKYYPQTHTFTWTVMGSFNALPQTCEAASVTLTPFYLKKKKKHTSSTFTHWKPLRLVFLTKWRRYVRVQKKQMFIIPATVYHGLSEHRWGSNSLIVLFMMKLRTFRLLWFYNMLLLLSAC